MGMVPDQGIVGTFTLLSPIKDLRVPIGPDLEEIAGRPRPGAAVVIPTAELSGFVGMADDGKVVLTPLPMDEKAGQHSLNPDGVGRRAFLRKAEISVDGVSVVPRQLMPDPQRVLTQVIQHIRHGIIREIEQCVLQVEKVGADPHVFAPVLYVAGLEGVEFVAMHEADTPVTHLRGEWFSHGFIEGVQYLRVRLCHGGIVVSRNEQGTHLLESLQEVLPLVRDLIQGVSPEFKQVSADNEFAFFSLYVIKESIEQLLFSGEDKAILGGPVAQVQITDHKDVIGGVYCRMVPRTHRIINLSPSFLLISMRRYYYDRHTTVDCSEANSRFC